MSAACSPVARRETRAHIDKYRWMRISPWKEAWFARSVAALREQKGSKRISRWSAGYSQTGNVTRP